MATVDDQAAAREELDRDIALKRRAPSGPEPCGRCYFCNSPVEPDARWCDADCRDDWQIEERARKQRV